MKKLIVLFFPFCFLFSSGQNNEESRTFEWIKNNNIELNNPRTPNGFERYNDCYKNVVFKRICGDTIKFYTFLYTSAKNLRDFIPLTRRSDYNIKFYPKQVLFNGDIEVVYLEPKVFLYRNDSLFELSRQKRFYNENVMIKNLDSLYKMKNIDNATFEKRGEAWKVENEKHYPMKFRFIFSKNLFFKTNSIIIPENEYFRQLKIELIEIWEKNGKEYYHFKTFDNIPFDCTFNSAKEFMDYENCIYVERY